MNDVHSIQDFLGRLREALFLALHFRNSLKAMLNTFVFFQSAPWSCLIFSFPQLPSPISSLPPSSRHPHQSSISFWNWINSSLWVFSNCHSTHFISKTIPQDILSLKIERRLFPGDPEVKNPPSNTENAGLRPHMLWGNYWAHTLWSPCTTTREKPACHKEDMA